MSIPIEISQAFKVKKILNQHSMKEHGINIARDIVCLLCHRFFQSRENLFTHRIQAHQSKTWKCKECGKVFGRKDYMEKHIKAIHMQTKFKCSECKAKFSYYAGLFSHTQKFHND